MAYNFFTDVQEDTSNFYFFSTGNYFLILKTVPCATLGGTIRSSYLVVPTNFERDIYFHTFLFYRNYLLLEKKKIVCGTSDFLSLMCYGRTKKIAFLLLTIKAVMVQKKLFFYNNDHYSNYAQIFITHKHNPYNLQALKNSPFLKHGEIFFVF